MTDKEIIHILETDCCAGCSYQPVSAIECKNTDCKYRIAIMNCISILRKKISDRTPFE